MLRRNIDVTVGLVNGAIGTVMGIYATRISIKFDHIDVPCDMERVTSRFMLYLKTKFNVKDDDSRSSVIVSIKLSNIKCKPKDDKTKCVVKNDNCSSSQTVSIILSSIKLKTSNPKKDDVIFTYEEPPNPDIVSRQRDYVYYPGNKEFQRRWCEILNLKFVTAARILLGSPTTPLSDERVPNSTLDVPGDGNCSFYALSYLITGSISQHYDLRKAIVSNMPNFEEELLNSTLSATRCSSIYDYINKSKMYRNSVWATETESITLSAILGTTIYSYSLAPTFVAWARYGTQELNGIPCDTNTPALYLKLVGTSHFQAVKSINIS
uniref:OTU domain-containing protein n=2 Tax=Amphimedon queenslandica TaxID=400682 RepID=A0A1X7VSW1_AMPQE